MKCRMCEMGAGKIDHLVYLAMCEMSTDGVVTFKGTKKQVLKIVQAYINKNLFHLNLTQIHYRIVKNGGDI